MSTATLERPTTTTVDQVPIDTVRPAPDNPRRDVGDVDELAASIKELGILEPLLVRALHNKVGQYAWELIAGERRWAAAKKAGLATVPVIVRNDLDDKQRLEAMLIENLQRNDLAPIEEATAYKKLLDLGLNQHQLAEKIGRSQSHISKRLSLLQLPDVAIKALDSGGITVQDAVELTKLGADPERVKVAIGNAGHWGGVERAVRDQLEEQRAAEQRAKVRAALQSGGVKILKEEDHYSWFNRKEKPLAGQGEHECINLTREQHKGEPCHAAAINRRAEVIYVCTKPERHPGLKKSHVAGLSSGEKAQRTKRLSQDKLKREATEARKKVMRSLLTKIPRSTAPHILLQLVSDGRSDHARIACDLLGLKPTGHVYQPELLRNYATKGETELWRASLAYAFAIAESWLRTGNHWRGSKDTVRRHLDVLKSAGHRLNPSERQAIR